VAIFTLLLGGLGFAGFPALKPYGEISVPPGRLAAYALVLSVLNYAIILRQAVPGHLLIRRAWLPSLVSFVTLSLIAALTVYVSLWLGATGSEPAALLRLLLISQGGLSAVLASSWLWKSDDELPGTLAVQVKAVRLIRNDLARGRSNDCSSARDIKVKLTSHLDRIADWIEKNGFTVLIRPEREMKQFFACVEQFRRMLPGIDIAAFSGMNWIAGGEKTRLLNCIADFG
jgi:hypothetical protein